MVASITQFIKNFRKASVVNLTIPDRYWLRYSSGLALSSFASWLFLLFTFLGQLTVAMVIFPYSWKKILGFQVHIFWTSLKNLLAKDLNIFLLLIIQDFPFLNLLIGIIDGAHLCRNFIFHWTCITTHLDTSIQLLLRCPVPHQTGILGSISREKLAPPFGRTIDRLLTENLP